jgi:hypothetical protein
VIVGVSIEKSMAFRGGVQPFANTYYYSGPVTETATVALTALVDDLKAKEQTQFGAHVSFVRGRCWKADGTQQQNIMIVDKVLSGVGAIATHANMDRERAYLVRFRAGVDSKGRPVYLRKWFHFGTSLFFGVAPSNNQLANLDQLTTTMRSDFSTWADGFKQMTNAGAGLPQMNLVSKNGRPIDGNTQAHPFIEHHQLGDEWRG